MIKYSECYKISFNGTALFSCYVGYITNITTKSMELSPNKNGRFVTNSIYCSRVFRCYRDMRFYILDNSRNPTRSRFYRCGGSVLLHSLDSGIFD